LFLRYCLQAISDYFLCRSVFLVCCYHVGLSCLSYTDKGKANPLQACTGPEGFQELEAPRFQDNRHMKVVRLSALGIGHLYPPGNIPGTHFC